MHDQLYRAMRTSQPTVVSRSTISVDAQCALSSFSQSGFCCSLQNAARTRGKYSAASFLRCSDAQFASRFCEAESEYSSYRASREGRAHIAAATHALVAKIKALGARLSHRHA